MSSGSVLLNDVCDSVFEVMSFVEKTLLKHMPKCLRRSKNFSILSLDFDQVFCRQGSSTLVDEIGVVMRNTLV